MKVELRSTTTSHLKREALLAVLCEGSVAP